MFARLDVACSHGLIVEGLRVEVDRLVLVDRGVAGLAPKSRHVVAKFPSWPRYRVAVLWILPVGRHVRYLQHVYCSRLVPISGRWLHKTCEVRLPVAVEGEDVTGVATILCVKALLQKVNVSRGGLH